MANTTNKESKESYNLGTSEIVAIINDKAQAQTACAVLTAAEFTDDAVKLFCGLKGERNLDLNGEHHGFLHNIKRKIQRLLVTTEAIQMDYYEQELLAGYCVIQVSTDFRNREQAHEILKSNGGRFINFFGLLTLEVLEP